ncbi:serine hydrolase domain-containing protein [Tenggerimyces flavus]|uniref:Serine hydrolase domain-containing protein n=1 Tax=Tenggerimyces flavus TaxID=1708749 RepID=A0ABV7YMK0_9ACTN|nr:serine hydrolase domain-containing protein [Tenggerimyces flavus]MBM7787319.1 CubicO group peptidase (beta-lactamase class C family) [Tenggerimyces flavus]
MTDLQAEVDSLVASGAERGLQVAIYQNGKQVAEVSTIPPDTPIFSFSLGKAVTATLVHRLVERGMFAYDTRLDELWPEFAQQGKEKVTVRHVLDHSAGLPGLPLDTTVDDLCDHDRICGILAEAEPWWEPGTAFGYHAYTFGYLLGEVVRRATGRTMSDILRTEITEPLGIANELFFAVPPSEQGRLANLENTDGFTDQQPPDGTPRSTLPSAELGNDPDFLAAEIPSVCTTSARAIARMLAALLDEVDGVRLLTEETLRKATAVSIEGVDRIHGVPSRSGLGYALALAGPTTFGMGGGGGSMAWADPTRGISFAVTKTKLSPGFDTASRLAP